MNSQRGHICHGTGAYSNCRTEFINSSLFVRICASLAPKYTCFSIIYVNGSPYTLAVIVVVVTNIPIIVLYGSGVVYQFLSQQRSSLLLPPSWSIVYSGGRGHDINFNALIKYIMFYKSPRMRVEQ